MHFFRLIFHISEFFAISFIVDSSDHCSFTKKNSTQILDIGLSLEESVQNIYSLEVGTRCILTYGINTQNYMFMIKKITN